MHKRITTGHVFAHLKVYYGNKVLRHMGGVLLDMDTICLKPLDELVYKYSFFAGLEPANILFHSPAINGGLIATTPQNAITERVIGMLEDYYSETDNKYRWYLNQYSSKVLGKGNSNMIGLVPG